MSCLADVVAVEVGGEVVDDDDVAVVVFDEAGRAKILYLISLLLSFTHTHPLTHSSTHSHTHAHALTLTPTHSVLHQYIP